MVARLTIVDRTGAEKSVEGQSGLSMMEIIRESGTDELLALCGGFCSCATCHVYVDDSFAGLLPEMSMDEDDLLNSSNHRKSMSRLSCQIAFSDALEGLKVTIAPED